MIRCLPRGICSWTFDLTGDGHAAEVAINWLSENGGLTIDGLRHGIRKHGAFSGLWSLSRADEPEKKLFSAKKSSVFTRTFAISGEWEASELKAVSAFGRGMELKGGGCDCVIAPDHLFTRRATITGEFGDFRLLAFAFWLSAITWRRAANSSGGGS